VHQGPGLVGEPEDFRLEVCEWLTHELAPDRTAPHAKAADRTGLAEPFERELQREAGRRGWLGVSLPAAHGGGGKSVSFAAVFGYEAAYHDAPVIDTAVTLAGAPIVAFGTPVQHAELLPRMLSGEIEMCIAYTEPDAGNDLASLISTAQPLPGGGYLLNGHKTLITGGDKADVCLTIARTDTDVPARRGSSMLLVDLGLPGVSVVAQRTMAGYDLWEVLFKDVRLGPEALLGTENGGWRQLAFAVQQERSGMFSLGWSQRLFDEILSFVRTSADGVRPADDPVIASDLAQLWADLQTARRSSLALVARENAGERSAAAASEAKVVTTELLARLAQFATEVGGPGATATGSLFGPRVPGVPGGGRFSYAYLYRFDGSVSVGANELHRIGIAASRLGVLAPGGAVTERPPLDLLADGAPIRARMRQLTVRGTDNVASRWDAVRQELWPVLASPVELCAALEELGRAGVALPLQGSLVQVHAALSTLGAAGQGHLRRLQSGYRFAMGMHDAQGRLAPENVILRALASPEGTRLSGIVRHVTYGDTVQSLVVPATSEEGELLLAAIPCDDTSISRVTRETISGDQLTDFTLTEVPLDPSWILGRGAAAESAVSAALAIGVMALSAQSVGMAAALVQLTASRVRSRHAFGAPLASLPTVQLRMGELSLELSAARAATTELALALTDAQAQQPLLLSATKITVASAASRIVAGAHQLCGGWGQLEEAGLHVYTRGLKAAEGQLGTTVEHRRRLGRLLTD
jgi:alkylation response protein AidB-like acyl-CoA dehydrogenase